MRKKLALFRHTYSVAIKYSVEFPRNFCVSTAISCIFLMRTNLTFLSIDFPDFDITHSNAYFFKSTPVYNSESLLCSIIEIGEKTARSS